CSFFFPFNVIGSYLLARSPRFLFDLHREDSFFIFFLFVSIEDFSDLHNNYSILSVSWLCSSRGFHYVLCSIVSLFSTATTSSLNCVCSCSSWGIPSSPWLCIPLLAKGA